MEFKNQRFITKGVAENVDTLLQIFMWECIETLPSPKDYLQVFEFAKENGKLKIVHSQEEPEYKREYLIKTDAPFFVGKIFVIDDETHVTMLLAEEY